MMKTLVTCSRIAFLCHHLWLAYVGLTKIYPTVHEAQNEELIYKANYAWALLSIWNLIFQGIYFQLALSSDFLVKDPKFKERIVKLNGYIFSALLFPLGIFTFVVFWSFYLFNRDLLAPANVIEVFPFYVQVGIHATSLLPIFTESFLAKLPLPNYSSAIVGLSVLWWFYFFLLIVIHYFVGIWMYSIFEFLSWSGRFLLGITAHVVAVFFLQSGIFLQNFTRNRIKSKEL